MYVPWPVHEDVIRIIIFIAQPLGLHGPHSLQSWSHNCPLNIRFPNSRGATYGVIFTFQVTLAACSAASIPHWNRKPWGDICSTSLILRYSATPGGMWLSPGHQLSDWQTAYLRPFLSLKSHKPDRHILIRDTIMQISSKRHELGI